MRYWIRYSPEALEHLQALSAAERATVVEAVEEQLADQPTVETRNRKLMRPNIFARWELRIRDVRVYYKVEDEPEPIVVIRGIGIKKRKRVWMGGEEVDFA